MVTSLLEIDWTNEIRLLLTALLLTAFLLGSTILILPHHLLAIPHYHRLAAWTAAYLPMPLSPPGPRSGPIYARPRSNDDPTRRTVFTDTSVTIYAWPSRGGVIILEEATHVDFDFLGLSTSDPPLKRDRGRHEPDDNKDDTDAAMVKEDVFCQRLLLLGAKWWDSEARHRFVARVGAGEGPAVKDVEEGRVEEATLRERRWIKVAWEGATAAAPGAAGGSGGFWVLDYDTNMLGILEEENLVPEDAGKVGLARSMEERCEILKKMGARFFGAMVDYEGETTFLRAWESKWEGEVGGLVKVEW